MSNTILPPPNAQPTPQRSKAWIFWALAAVGAVLSVPSSHGLSLFGAVGCGLYSRYLYRGGRFVIWFW